MRYADTVGVGVVPESYAGLVDGASRSLIPLSVGIELTGACNLRCRHCYQIGHVRADGELDAGGWIGVLDALVEAGTLFVTFTGGEVFTRPEALDVFEAARARGFAVRVFTNATLIDGAAAERVARLKPLSVEVSVYSDEAGSHDSITGVPGSHARALSGIRMLIERGVLAVIKSPVMTVNADRVGALVALSERIGAELRLDLDIVCMDDGSRSPLDLRLDDAGLRAVLAEPWVRERFLRFDVERPEGPNDICGAARRTCAISSSGEVYPCNQLTAESAGSLKEQTFGEIWQRSPVMQAVREKRVFDLCEECRLCPRLAYCGRCGAIALQEDGDYLGPSSWACRVARAKESVRDAAGSAPEGGADEL